MNASVQTACAAELESLAQLRRVVSEFCHAQQIGEDLAYELTLAIDEACTNIIIHGYAGMNPGSILLRLDRQMDRVLVTLTDFGRAFQPVEPDKPDVEQALEEGRLGGFGLFFIYRVMDQVSYEADPEQGNRLMFMKALAPEAGGEGPGGNQLGN